LRKAVHVPGKTPQALKTSGGTGVPPVRLNLFFPFLSLALSPSIKRRLTLAEQQAFTKTGRDFRVDGARVEQFKLPHGYWEAKDFADDLEKEITKKFTPCPPLRKGKV
jgi:hypothetical protein